MQKSYFLRALKNIHLDRCYARLDRRYARLDLCNVRLDRCNVRLDQCYVRLDRYYERLDRCYVRLDRCYVRLIRIANEPNIIHSCINRILDTTLLFSKIKRTYFNRELLFISR